MWRFPRASAGTRVRLLVITLTLSLLIVLAGNVPPAAAAVPQYMLVELPPILDAVDSQAQDVNRYGHVGVYSQKVGSFYGGFYDGVQHVRACSLNSAGGVNTAGRVAGHITIKRGKKVNYHAATCQGSAQTDLGSGSFDHSQAHDLNDAGQVIGRAYYGSPGNSQNSRGIRWSGGVLTDLGTLNADPTVVPNEINDGGVIVGWTENASQGVKRPFVWSPATQTMSALPLLSGHTNGQAYGINGQGQIVGTVSNSSGEIAVVWPVGSSPVALPPLSGFAETDAASINDSGQVVGTASNPCLGYPCSPLLRTVFLYSDGVMYDLNQSVALPSGYRISDAVQINDAGQIAVTVEIPPNRVLRAGLLTPSLLDLYAPVLKYDSLENYFADSPATITDNYDVVSRTYTNRLMESQDTYAIAASDPDYQDPVMGNVDSLSLTYLGPSQYASGRAVDPNDHIDEANSYEGDAQRLHADPSYGNKAYGRVLPITGGGKVLQYWFFYYYNGPRPFGAGEHEGDWEMVQYELDPNNRPVRAAYAQHGGGERCDWIFVPRDSRRHPIVYVGFGSHASFYSAGTHFIDAGAIVDNVDGMVGPIALSVVDITSAPPWVTWPGRWGGSSSSPTGPGLKGQKWTDPAAWANAISGCTEFEVFPLVETRHTPAAELRSDLGTIQSKGGPGPSAPQVVAARQRESIVIRYRFEVTPDRPRPVSLVTSVRSAERTYPPLTYMHKVEGLLGKTVQSRGLGRGPWTVRVVGFAANGVRGQTATLVVR